MTQFRILLGLMLISLLIYTVIVISNHGLNLFPIFFGDIKAMTWPGQFNFDFLGFLVLSGLWVSWRHHFSAKGLVLGAIALTCGILFLSVYLLVISFKTEGDIKKIMLGDKRAAQSG